MAIIDEPPQKPQPIADVQRRPVRGELFTLQLQW
jgi:hypothetical protein